MASHGAAFTAVPITEIAFTVTPALVQMPRPDQLVTLDQVKVQFQTFLEDAAIACGPVNPWWPKCPRVASTGCHVGQSIWMRGGDLPNSPRVEEEVDTCTYNRNLLRSFFAKTFRKYNEDIWEKLKKKG